MKTSKSRVNKLARRVAATSDEKPAPVIILYEDEPLPPGTPDNAHVIRICYDR